MYSILVQDGNLFNICRAKLEKQGDGFFTDSSSLSDVPENTIRDCQADPEYILTDGVDRFGGEVTGTVDWKNSVNACRLCMA